MSATGAREAGPFSARPRLRPGVRNSRAALPLLLGTIANLPLLYALVDASRGAERFILPVFGVGAIAMAQAWAAGSVIERRTARHRVLFTWLIAAASAVELPLAWGARDSGFLPRLPAYAVLCGAVASACGLVAVALLYEAQRAPRAATA